MRNYLKTWCLAGVLATTVLLTPFSASAVTAPKPAEPVLGGGNPNPGVPPNCLSRDQVGVANPGIHPPCSKPYGLTYGEWSARWWEWIESIPTAKNPNFDTTGAHCAEGQTGPVWFLAGDFGGTVVRHCTIPTGVSVLFPVIDNGFGVLGGDCWGTGGPNPNPALLPNCLDQTWSLPDPTTLPTIIKSWAQLAAFVASFYDTPALLHMNADIDTVHLSTTDLIPYRAKAGGVVTGAAPMFAITVPPGNILGLPAGTYFPNGSDGFWLMLTPLPPGTHYIHFASGDGFLDVTYFLTVAPGHH
jgi:hypothetical protein